MILGYDMTYNRLKKILQDKLKEINLEDLYELSYHFNDDVKYLPDKYKNEYRNNIVHVMIKRYNLLKDDTKNYPGKIAKEKIDKINELLNMDFDDKILNKFNIINIYTIYFLKKPIHPTSSIFAGLNTMVYDGKDYLCPIKKYHIDDDKSLCKYCIAKEV